MKGEKTQDRAVRAGVTALAAAELLDCRAGGDHEDLWLWIITGTLDPPGIPTGTGPTYPPPAPAPPG